MIQPGVENLNYELIDVDCYHGKKSLKIIVFIDHVSGIKIDDCVKITKAISPIIDEHSDLMEDYKLEVSSPGLNRKLILKEHYDQFIGKMIKVKLIEKMNNQKYFKGKLLKRVDSRITISDKHNQKINIRINLIEICRLVPVFNDTK